MTRKNPRKKPAKTNAPSKAAEQAKPTAPAKTAEQAKPTAPAKTAEQAKASAQPMAALVEKPVAGNRTRVHTTARVRADRTGVTVKDGRTGRICRLGTPEQSAQVAGDILLASLRSVDSPADAEHLLAVAETALERVGGRLLELRGEPAFVAGRAAEVDVGQLDAQAADELEAMLAPESVEAGGASARGILGDEAKAEGQESVNEEGEKDLPAHG